MQLNCFRTLFAIIFIGLSASISYAEIIDNSSKRMMTEESSQKYYAKTFATRDARWISKPNFTLSGSLRDRLEPGTYHLVLRLTVDKQGETTKISMIKSSANRRLDKFAITQMQQVKLAPFIIEGKPAKGSIVIPIQFVLE